MADLEKAEVKMVEDEMMDEGVKTKETMTKADGTMGDVDDDEDIMDDAPPEVSRRIKALKKNQLEIIKLEAQFYKEIHQLQCKYTSVYQPLFDKRSLIVTGQYEPTDEECDLGEFDAIEDLKAIVGKMVIDVEGKKDKVVGIPQFWSDIFCNVELLSDIVEEYDLPILKHLVDIQVEMISEPLGFKLHFHFTPNEYFSNSILSKTYLLKCEVDMKEPSSFEGAEIVKCFGCTVDWAKGKNVTEKIIRKSQKHKQRGCIRTVCKTVQANSFFNFFNPPTVPEDKDGGAAKMDTETQLMLINDFEVGQYIREKIVPHAVWYYTGEAGEEEEEEDDDDDDDDKDEHIGDGDYTTETDDSEDECEGHPKKGRGSVPSGKPQECKQQ